LGVTDPGPIRGVKLSLHNPNLRKQKSKLIDYVPIIGTKFN